MKKNSKPHQLAQEAKAIVALAFRNGPIEDIHAGKPCPTCQGQLDYSRISDAEMKAIMKRAVDKVFELLSLKATDVDAYTRQIEFGSEFTAAWDEPTEHSSRDAYVEENGRLAMREINRSAVIFIPKQPFLDWLHAVDPSSVEVTLSELAMEPDVYLLPACESDAEFDRKLEKFFSAIFESLLEGWWTDRDAWPKNRTLARYRSWFEIRYHSLVLDLLEKPPNYVD